MRKENTTESEQGTFNLTFFYIYSIAMSILLEDFYQQGGFQMFRICWFTTTTGKKEIIRYWFANSNNMQLAFQHPSKQPSISILFTSKKTIKIYTEYFTSMSSPDFISLVHNKNQIMMLCVCFHRNKKDEFGENFHHH